MKILIIAFIAFMGLTCVAAYATSQTLHSCVETSERGESRAPAAI